MKKCVDLISVYGYTILVFINGNSSDKFILHEICKALAPNSGALPVCWKKDKEWWVILYGMSLTLFLFLQNIGNVIW